MKNKLVNFFKNVIFISASILIRFVYFFMCLFPINNRKVIGNHFDGKPYGDSPKVIFEEIKRIDPNVKLFWVFNGKKKRENGITYVNKKSLSYLFHLATSKIWVSSVRMPYYIFKRKNQIYYQTWHGAIGLKKVENECPEKLSDRYVKTAKHDSKMISFFVSDNDDSTALFEQYFWCKNPKILKFGCPRNDVLFLPGNKTIIENSFGIKNKNVVLYAPTFRVDESFTNYDIDLNRLVKCLQKRFGGDWVIVVRLHPRIAHNSHKFIKYDANILDGSNIENIQDVLSSFDALITDYSSIIIDFMMTNKPAFIYASDIADYKKDRDFHIDIYELPFSISENNDELEKNILEFDYKVYNNHVSLFKKKINFYSNGDAGKRTAEHILKQIYK